MTRRTASIAVGVFTVAIGLIFLMCISGQEIPRAGATAPAQQSFVGSCKEFTHTTIRSKLHTRCVLLVCGNKGSVTTLFCDPIDPQTP